MDSTNESETREKNEEVKQNSESPLGVASISLSISTTVFPLLQPKIPTIPQPNKVKVPTQASSLTHLSLSTTTSHSPSSITSFKSTLSATPLHAPLSLNPLRPRHPSNAAALRRASVVWFRNDLRVLDNQSLAAANSDSLSVLPVYCFDPADYGKSASGFDKTGPYRASFLLDSIADLRRNLRARGSDLVVRLGKPETVLPELAKAVGADAVYAHLEVSHDEVRAEERVEKKMKEESVEVKYFWGSTLFHVDDLPFKLEDMPSNYGGFRDRVHKLEIRKTIEALDQLKGLPSRGDVEPGDIPTLSDLGLNPSATMSQDGKAAANACMVGGETEALQRLKKFVAECEVQPHKAFKDGTQSIYGANFSCKISPWLAMGCLSPRIMYEELKKTASRATSASANRSDGGNGSSKNGTNWLMFELMWRDFFSAPVDTYIYRSVTAIAATMPRFITKKYSSAKKQLEAAPATACAGAFA